MVQPSGNVATWNGKKPLITGDYCREEGEVGEYERASLNVKWAVRRSG